jgi:integrase
MSLTEKKLDRPIGGITKPEGVDTLRPIWHEKNETARRTLGRLQEIFELAESETHITSNPARFNPQTAFGRVRRKTQHFGSLLWERMQDLWHWLMKVRCDEITRQFVMLLLLSGKRTGEVRFARHSWFSGPSLEVWETPAEYMKIGQSHRVPASRQIATIVDNMNVLSGGYGFLFLPPPKSGVVSENAALVLLKRFGTSITGHGARASFNGWPRSQGRYQRDTIEFALALGLPRLEAAHMREDLLEERRSMMQDWADFVTGDDGVPSLRILGSWRPCCRTIPSGPGGGCCRLSVLV